jgi:uncharacterized lipoprotein YddW (UPF0748 family)
MKIFSACLSRLKSFLFFSFFIGLSITWSACSRNVSKADKIIGIKTYTVQEDYSKAFFAWKELGINTLFISKELLADAKFASLAEDNNLDRFLIAPVFYNPDFLAKNPNAYAIDNRGNHAVDDWVEFVCPSQNEYLEILKDSLLTLVDKYNPDGVSLDFIRHFAFWEMVHPDTKIENLPRTCCCKRCQKKYFGETKQDIEVMEPVEFYNWVSEFQLEAWNKFRNKQIVDVFAILSKNLKKAKPNLVINLHAVPWNPKERNNANYTVVGQNVAEIAKYADYVSPMCYHFMVKEKPNWVKGVFTQMNTLAPGKVIPSIQVGNAYRPDALPLEEFVESLKYTQKEPSMGVVFWSWEYLQKEPEKIRAAIEILSK